jgi:hypothetical protein
MTQVDKPRDFDPFMTLVKGCFFTDHLGYPPDFSDLSLDSLLKLARTAARLVEWPDPEILELRDLLSDAPPEARAWIESRWQCEEASKKRMADSLKAQKLDTWSEALFSELQRRRRRAEKMDVTAIDQALAQIRFLLEYVPGSALRAAPRWDEEPR